eukprot:CAMPEP_0170496932 /NCGR_PEP_ID=MMETSP0208-20121228/23175_1 /TAXON_ID=197538 /ORGANISM="Strombidium inclinatum, Strain S3" /LENGTH=107 /DNA_ID=CAMNT_0010773593 /DNA_START=3870 /DNA_END=4193 /DNA_ORIENTATION=+
MTPDPMNMKNGGGRSAGYDNYTGLGGSKENVGEKTFSSHLPSIQQSQNLRVSSPIRNEEMGSGLLQPNGFNFGSKTVSIYQKKGKKAGLINDDYSKHRRDVMTQGRQ